MYMSMPKGQGGQGAQTTRVADLMQASCQINIAGRSKDRIVEEDMYSYYCMAYR